MRVRRWFGVLLSVGAGALLAGACGGKSRVVEDSARGNGSGGTGGTNGARGGSGQGGETSEALESFDDALRVAKCAREQRCGPFWVDEATCVEDARAYPRRFRFETGNDYAALLEATYRLGSAEARAACLDAIEQAYCDDERTPFLACREALIPRRPGGEGDGCRTELAPWHQGTTCAAGLTCDTQDTCGTCILESTGVEGSSCRRDGECEPGLWCLPESRTCGWVSDLPGEGESCEDRLRCAVGTRCFSGGGGRRCIRLPGLGEPCDFSHVYCQGGLTCEEGDVSPGEGTCQLLARRGEPCTRSPGLAADSCANGLACIFDEANAPTGTCGAYPLPAVGPCVRAGTAVYFACPSNVSYSDPRPDGTDVAPVYCNCLPAKPVGEECVQVEECETKFCALDAGYPGHCVEPKEAGDVCYANLDCASRECGPANRCLSCG